MNDVGSSVVLNVTDIISLGSLFISTIALCVTVIYNAINQKRYIDSLSPLLSFRFFQQDGILYLTIDNRGQSFAKDIKIDIKGIYNNGDRNMLELDDLFNNKFCLFPDEKVQGIIGFPGESIEQKIFPYIDVDIKYIKGNDSKIENYCRTITFTRNPEEIDNLRNLENSLKSISYSTNRVANYIEGRTLFVFDEINTLPKSSLAKDMKDAFNNRGRNKKRYK